MISPISTFSDKKISFKQQKRDDESLLYDKDTLLENNFSNRMRIGMGKLTKAFTIYPAKGLAGSRNSNFYEFLTMGTVPYIIGSATLMSIFNSANKYYHPFEKAKASIKLGNKMALGVMLYALLKPLSNALVNVPVKFATGIDTQLPYAKVNYQLQESPNDYDLTSIEYHKIGESVDFTRWDLLYGDPQNGEKTNFRYDKIAKKNGLGSNLNDSDQEVKPIYKEVLVKSAAARTFASYMWAAVGVALAFQKPWENYFNVATLKFWKLNEFGHSLNVLGKSFINSAKSLYHGPESATSAFRKHSGKYLLGSAVAVTALGVLNAIHITKKPSKLTAADVLDQNKESVVS